MKAKVLHTIYVGKGDKAKALPPDEVIDTKKEGISATDVDVLINTGFLVEVQTSAESAAPAPSTDPADPATGD